MQTTEHTTAKLFMNGRSQAVRLPKEFRFEGKEVLIEKKGEAVILRPQPANLSKSAKQLAWEAYLAEPRDVPDDFLSDEFLASLRNDPLEPKDIF